ncbi:MAG: hypothetical protein ACKV22_23720 [Bryobacteraceae bacterium]
MAHEFEQERQQAHAYLDRLSPEQLSAVSTLLATMLKPASSSPVQPPLAEEEVIEDEERGVAESREWLKHHKPIPHEEVLAELGISIREFEQMAATPLDPDPSRKA